MRQGPEREGKIAWGSPDFPWNFAPLLMISAVLFVMDPPSC